MYINTLGLENFRNYKNQNIEFNKNINIIYGDNAQGKTNIIESIYLCSMGKSFRARKDSDLINFEENVSKITLSFYKEERTHKIKAEIGKNKTFFYNDIKQNKVSDIVGKLNCVIFTPDDINIIKNGPDGRRRFLNLMISSLRPNYIHLLNNYNKVLEERNNYLKQIKEKNISIDLLDVYDEQLSDYSEQIHKYREEYSEKFSEKIEDIHNQITKCGKEEIIKIKYISSGKDKVSYLENLKKSRSIDINRGYTGVGIHRDDLLIYVNHKPVGVFGSQGQQRTAMLSLKLCELEIAKEELGESPVLLLDDFMSELDENRRNSFLENISGCQVILTCTDKFLLSEKTTQKIFYVKNGSIKEE